MVPLVVVVECQAHAMSHDLSRDTNAICHTSALPRLGCVDDDDSLEIHPGSATCTAPFVVARLVPTTSTIVCSGTNRDCKTALLGDALCTDPRAFTSNLVPTGRCDWHFAILKSLARPAHRARLPLPPPPSLGSLIQRNSSQSRAPPQLLCDRTSPWTLCKTCQEAPT